VKLETTTAWPALPLDAWRDTYATVHRWAQIVGKLQLALVPIQCHYWNAALQITPRGLGTAWIMASDGRWLDMELDFLDDVLRIRISDGTIATVKLAARSVADFYRDTIDVLAQNGISVHLFEKPVEVFDDRTPFSKDVQHHAYDKEAVLRFWQIAGRVTILLTKFRSKYLGKSSPAQFYWGHFDLALSVFSGRKTPDEVTAALTDKLEREGYSHELFAVGWWPGDVRLEKPSFYSYAAPEPDGFAKAQVETPSAYYDPNLHGFYLDYDAVRAAPDPDAMVLDFFQSTYDAAARLGGWDRPVLERTGAMS
jgi:hypothetical protein